MAWMIRRDYSQSTSTNSDLLASVYLILMLGGMILPSTSLCVVTFSCMSLATLTARRTLPATRRASPLFQHCFSMIFPWPKKWKSMTYRHWLKVQERIEYKIISTTYKVLQSSRPHYLRDIITIQYSYLLTYLQHIIPSKRYTTYECIRELVVTVPVRIGQ